MKMAKHNRIVRHTGKISVLLITSLLAGCFKLGPDFQSPSVKVQGDWLERSSGSLKRGDVKEWWKIFKDPGLDRLITTAYQQNLDLQKAAVRIMEARAQLGFAKGSLFPQQQQATVDLGYHKLSEHMPNITETSFSAFQTGFDAVWEVDLWGRFRRGIESADAKLTASQLDYDDVLVSLTAEVAASYVQIRTFEQRLRLAQSNVELQQESLRIATTLYRNGLNTELDMQQARALLHSTKAQLSALEIGLRQSRNALCTLLGMPPNRLADLLDSQHGIPDAPAEVVAGIPNDILRRRPDVRREEMLAAAQSAMIGVAKADLLPRFSLQGSIGVASSNGNGFDVFDAMNLNTLAAKVGPTVNWPILQYGRLKNNVRVQDARFQALLINYRQTVLRALREVEDAMVGFLRSREQVAGLQESVMASSRAVDLSLAQYRDGVEDYTRVLNSQQFLVQQQDRLTASQGEVARNLVAMYKALGGGWELRQNHESLPEAIKTDMQQRTDWGNLLDDHQPETLIDD